jgi:NDP-sugar pyrophosphorylase family protein
MYPVIPIPAHIGVTVLSPKVYPMFSELFDYEKKSDFEKVLFPILAERKQLYATSIPTNCWVAVNNPKSYNELLSRLGLK